ncbi:MAG: hypothetical protein FWD45_00520 [Coriobacteriia bacterium]|nr:hypothetical protein [Coriobacteriia bacterium]
MKRKTIVFAVVAVSMILIPLAFSAGACSVSREKVPEGFVELRTSNQRSGTINYTNYMVIISTDIDWDNLSAEKKLEIIEYSFQISRAAAQENSVSNFNITGFYENDDIYARSIPLFYYDQANDEVIIYIGGEPAERVPAPSVSTA